MLNAITPTFKTGTESLALSDTKLPFTVLSFWQWSSSNLLSNALRGVLAEWIVSTALNLGDKPREEWDSVDLITKSGLKIEIKSAAYLQSWNQNDISKISFGIQPTTFGELSDQKQRQADIYIFCVLNHKDKASVDPLNLEQWDFYILKTSVLNERVSKQKTISLSSLLKLNPVHVKYNEIKSVVDQIQRTIPSC